MMSLIIFEYKLGNFISEGKVKNIWKIGLVYLRIFKKQ